MSISRESRQKDEDYERRELSGEAFKHRSYVDFHRESDSVQVHIPGRGGVWSAVVNLARGGGLAEALPLLLVLVSFLLPLGGMLWLEVPVLPAAGISCIPMAGTLCLAITKEYRRKPNSPEQE